MRSRGAALPTVLALISAVLVIGLAMGSLSTLSLQFNRRQIEGMRAEMAARSGIAHLLARLREIDAQAKLNPLRPEPSSVAEQFAQPLVVVEGQHRVTIHFDTNREGYSSDNLAGDSPAVGWPDNDDVPRIPRFGLDVILNVEGPSGDYRFRAGLKRVWPYALYTTLGPIVLMGQPNVVGGSGDPFPFPSNVKGDLYTSWQGDAANGGTDTRGGYGLGRLDEPSKLLAYIEARNGYHPHAAPAHPLIVGMPLAYNAPIEPSSVNADSTSSRQFFRYADSLVSASWDIESSDPVFGAVAMGTVDRGNRLDGDLYYDHDKDGYVLEPVVFEDDDNIMTGEAIRRRGLLLDPLAEIGEGNGPPASTFENSGFQELHLSRPDPSLEEKYGVAMEPEDVVHHDQDFGGPPFLLTEDLVLTETENSTGGTVSTHYEVNGSLSNRQVVYSEGTAALGAGLMVRQERKGIKLQGTILHIKGNLDLGGIDPDGPGGLEVDPVNVIGSGATLIVDGQLILGNANINAEDQGFVLYARDIVLKGGGDFRGLMIAERSISILTQNERPLNIRGALLCHGIGGITFRGGTLEHDPQYLKSINGGGDFVMDSWKKL